MDELVYVSVQIHILLIDHHNTYVGFTHEFRFHSEMQFQSQTNYNILCSRRYGAIALSLYRPFSLTLLWGPAEQNSRI